MDGQGNRSKGKTYAFGNRNIPQMAVSPVPNKEPSHVVQKASKTAASRVVDVLLSALPAEKLDWLGGVAGCIPYETLLSRTLS